MAVGKRNDRKQPPLVAPRKMCFEKSAKSVKLVKKFKFPEKEGIYMISQPCLNGMLPDNIPFLLPSNARMTI